jgi:uncharacterized protein (TIGR00251 family)
MFFRISDVMDIRDASRSVKGGVEIDIMVMPNSSRQGSDGVNEWRKRMIVRVLSPPMDGKANKEAEEYVTRVTGQRSEIIKGHTGRQKTIMVYGDPDAILSSLEALK